MIDISEVERSFKKFRDDFWEDVTDINLAKSEVKIEDLKTKMMDSDYFKVVKKFAEERGWDVVSEDLTLSVKKAEKDEIVELPLVSTQDDATVFIQPWSRVVDKLVKLEEE
ncbi:MAG TPA: hypothetical protein ENG74_00355 [Thermoplasmatales archaeon]|nr:hypothetical protein [Thermoplasmatales archaeon]